MHSTLHMQLYYYYFSARRAGPVLHEARGRILFGVLTISVLHRSRHFSLLKQVVYVSLTKSGEKVQRVTQNHGRNP